VSSSIDLSPRLKQKVDSELRPGESILWMSHPKTPAEPPGFLARFMRPENLFVITNQRAIRFYGNRFKLSSISYPPEKLQNVKYVERADGSGDLIFVTYKNSKRWTVNFGFLQVPDVREADRILRESLGAKHVEESSQ
jgi:hypothetical protein